jgi:mono/diheme cytochrome c family protein
MMRHMLWGGLLVAAFTSCIAGTSLRATVNETLPPDNLPSGKVTYLRHCATCHGVDAKGRGPLGLFLKTPPSDLTLLASRHGGKFPYQYVSKVLEFGPAVTTHGSSDMPTWGPIFSYFDKQDQRIVQQRIRNLCNYLASLQQPSETLASQRNGSSRLEVR